MQRFEARLVTGNWPNNPEPLVRNGEGDFVKYDDALQLEIAVKELLNAIRDIPRSECIDHAITLANKALLNK